VYCADKNDYEIRINVWHSVATITTTLVCTLYSILN
jgi:hypothetical protein